MIDLAGKLDDLGDEQRMLRDAGADFFASDEEGRPLRDWRGRAPGYDRARWRKMAALGWTGLCLPEAYGGSGCGLAQAALLLEQCGRALAPEPLVGGALLPAWALLHGDNEALRTRWLPALARGEQTLALAWQEREHEQSLRPDSLRATPRGDRFVLDGAKRFVAAAEGAGAFVVSALAPQGPVLLLVEAGQPGLTLGTLARVDGGFWGELQFKGVEAGAAQLVADAPRADAVLQRALDLARIAAAAELLGVMGRALDSSVQYIAVREQFGRPVGSFQALQHRAANLLIQVELTRAVVAQSAALADAQGTDAGRLSAAASQAKARASAAALEVTKGCIQLHGGIGYTDECAIGLYLKKAMVSAAWLGTAAWHRRRYDDLAPTGGDEAAPELVVGGEQPIRRDELRRWLADNFPPAWRFPSSRLSPARHARVARQAQRPRLGRAQLAKGTRRHGPGRLRAGGAAVGIRPPRHPDRAQHGGGDARPANHPLRHRSAEARDPAAHPVRRSALVPGLFRALGRIRPGQPAHLGGGRR
jgi:alkylation response protein AidB-like acyl-CoA dehydrogenase